MRRILGLGDVAYNSFKNNNFFYAFMNTLKFTLENVLELRKCNYNNNEKYNIEEQNFMDMKTLFDYSKDYDQIQKDLKNHELFCNHEYKAHLDKYALVYEKLMKKCPRTGIRHSFCSGFNEFFIRNDRFEISTLSCSEVQDDATTAKLEEEQLNSIKHNMKQEDYLLPIRQNLEYIISNNPLDTSRSTVIAPLFVGITVLSIILYKFTPLGYWLKKSLLGKYKG
ncbi:variable surface protein [Plasmodium gonderi]|uniref:Variable surface protein n=1 Tax=Plasmodium gonderi TaxID=77519 RepID=A0A1Y1JKN3_PLAGO|nr:variable surface protein [Plasmodium gonderi]GAW82015.1 variable surface protein [Plasmodium gonderi]